MSRKAEETIERHEHHHERRKRKYDLRDGKKLEELVKDSNTIEIDG